MAEIQWQSKFIAAEKKVEEGISKMIIRGVLIDTTENRNFWQIESADFKSLAIDFVGKQLRCDHGEKISNVLGKIISTEVDEGHDFEKNEWDPKNINDHIHYVAEIATADETLIVPIQKGFITHVSPAVDARTLLCGTCKTPMKDKNTRNCGCSEGSLLLKDLSARELSLVASPAYANTVAKVYSFSAAVDNEIKRNILNKGEIDMVNEDRIVRLEASVSALIAAFKAAAEEQEEEKKEEMKAEEEAVLKAEEEEAKMVPVSKVAEEEEEADKEEEELKVEEEAGKKIEKLEASIRQLTRLMKAGKITPETPEDEPAETVHKIPKISNEPVKSEKLKDGFKLPLITGGMKPGKLHATAGKTAGKSQSFTGADKPAQVDNEQQAVDEIFGFAASRGTIPMKADSRIRTIQYK